MDKLKLTAVGGKGAAAPDLKAADDFYRSLEVDVLARTLWGEARGEGERGMEAVACVVLNRVAIAQARGKFWWGGDVISVCQKPYQFSCWNRSDPSYKKLLAADSKNKDFVMACLVARRAVHGALADITGGATHYHADYVSPYWAQGEKPTATIGRHIFYRLI